MGKPLIQQRRGKGTGRFRAPDFRYRGEVKILKKDSYEVKNLVRCPGHTAPLIEAIYDDNTEGLLIAPEGVAIGDSYSINNGDVTPGSINKLVDLPEGTSIFFIENVPGDGGKFVRGSGSYARVISKSDDFVTVMLPSKKPKKFNPNCMAMVGVPAGGGRTEKPIVKAGKKHYMAKSKNKFFPVVSGSAMNAVAHPFGNKRTSRKSNAKPAPKNAPPGRKVGHIRPKRTGRRNK